MQKSVVAIIEKFNIVNSCCALTSVITHAKYFRIIPKHNSASPSEKDATPPTDEITKGRAMT